MRKVFLIYEEMCKYLVIHEEAVSHIGLCNRSTLNFPIYEENLFFFFISVIHCPQLFILFYEGGPSGNGVRDCGDVEIEVADSVFI
jgi:hypothetical protein